MQTYRDRSGNSGVVAYGLGPDFIDVEFWGGRRYRYTHQVPGQKYVETMKQLATAGENLATYINQHVREHYAIRLR